MATLDDVKEKLIAYKKQFHPNIQYEMSEWYSLFPQFRDKELEEQRKQWPGKYPLFEKQGVYLIFNGNKNLIYIGKASMNNNLGGRLNKYFSYESDKITCKVNDKWECKPEYLVTIAVPDGMSFEAAAIEEYLITELAGTSLENKVGNA